MSHSTAQTQHPDSPTPSDRGNHRVTFTFNTEDVALIREGHFYVSSEDERVVDAATRALAVIAAGTTRDNYARPLIRPGTRLNLDRPQDVYPAGSWRCIYDEYGTCNAIYHDHAGAQ